jgi:hypothetical protein
MEKQVVIKRDDLLSVSIFAKKFGIPRSKVYDLIRQNLLSGEIISGTFYPNISDPKAIKKILEHKVSRDSRGTWPRQPNRGAPRGYSRFEDQFEKDWRESMGIKD